MVQVHWSMYLNDILRLLFEVEKEALRQQVGGPLVSMVPTVLLLYP
jgi:hypothetical protein